MTITRINEFQAPPEKAMQQARTLFASPAEGAYYDPVSTESA